MDRMIGSQDDQSNRTNDCFQALLNVFGAVIFKQVSCHRRTREDKEMERKRGTEGEREEAGKEKKMIKK
jgi:hypothetical protein